MLGLCFPSHLGTEAPGADYTWSAKVDPYQLPSPAARLGGSPVLEVNQFSHAYTFYEKAIGDLGRPLKLPALLRSFFNPHQLQTLLPQPGRPL